MYHRDMKIKIDIRPHTAKEEFNYIWNLLEELPFIKKNNYTVKLPKHPVFLKLAQKSPKFGRVNKADLFDLFQKEIYDPDFFKQGIFLLKNYQSMFKKAISRFAQMNKKWGFKIFPKYRVLLTRYGLSGAYYPHEGKVIMMLGADGTFEKTLDPGETVIHEIIHTGIEENIINHFNLDHWEKERIVDLICILKFGDLLPNYQIQQQGNKNIDSYISLTSIDQLPQTMEKYVTDFTR